MKRIVWFSILLSLILTGCAVKGNYAMREWSGTMRQMGIVPLYPPREDVYVGDIYVTGYDPNDETTRKAFEKGELSIGMDPRWATLLPVQSPAKSTVLEQLVNDYRTRPTWPTTPDDYLQMISNGSNMDPELWKKIWIQPTSGKTAIYQTDETINRLRVVGFPEFISTTFTQGDLSGLVPVGVFNLTLGSSWNKASSVVVKVPAAESYSLPAHDVLKNLVDGGEIRQLYSENLDVVKPISFAKKAKPGEKNIYLTVITEVYYARVMDISMHNNSAKGFQIQGQPKATPGSNNEDKSKTADPCLADSSSKNYDSAKCMNQKLANSGNLSLPGGAVAFTNVSDHVISMRRVWEHPIAIGFRSLVLEVKSGQGCCEVVGSVSNSGKKPNLKTQMPKPQEPNQELPKKEPQ